MKSWRLSWRAAIAWILGALIAGAFYGMSLSLCNVLISPSEMRDFGISSAVLIGAGFAIFLVLAGVSDLISSVLWRLVAWWPRPWTEMALCTLACILAIYVFGVEISFSNNGETVPAMSNPIAFYGIHIAPVVAGLLAPYLYWLIARPKRD